MSNTRYHSIGLKVKEKQESNPGRQSDDIEDVLQSFKERGLLFVGGAFGELIVYTLCMSLKDVNEIENLYKTKKIEISLNTVLNVVVEIDDGEFTRCRWFFSKRCSRNYDKWFEIY